MAQINVYSERGGARAVVEYSRTAPGEVAIGVERFVGRPHKIYGSTPDGSFVLTVGPESTPKIPNGSTAAQVQAEVEKLDIVAPGSLTITGTGTDGDPYVLTWLSPPSLSEGDWDRSGMDDFGKWSNAGMLVVVDRDGCNRLIRAVREARDKAYGRDE